MERRRAFNVTNELVAGGYSKCTLRLTAVCGYSGASRMKKHDLCNHHGRSFQANKVTFCDMTKILVIGSQGYLGTRLVEYLRDYGHAVQGMDIGNFQSCILDPNFTEGHTSKRDALDVSREDIEGFDAVINLASNANDPTSNVDPERYYSEGVRFSERIAIDCKAFGIRYIFPSSCSVYGAGEEGICSENSETKPLTAYSKSKVIIENKLAKLSDENFSPVALRLATVFGYSPRIRFDLVINMFIGMLITENSIMLNSNGESWRPHVYIEDVMEAFNCAAQWDVSSGKLEVLNIGNEENNLTVKECASQLSQLFPGSKVSSLDENLSNKIFADRKVVEGKDARDYRVDFSKVYSRLPGFSIKTPLLEGAQELIEKLQGLNLDGETLRNEKFYRLKFLEGLAASKSSK